MIAAASTDHRPGVLSPADGWLVAALVFTATAVLALYFFNSPHAVVEFDSQNSFGTPTYLGGARDLLHGHFFSTGRLPGYPLMLALFGAANGFYTLVISAQGLMFLATVVITYYVARRAFGNLWIAFVAGLIIATDIYAAAYSKEILSESLALVLVSGLMACLVSFALKPRPRAAWMVAAFATAVTFTRPEWTFLPLVLGIYFGVWAVRRRFAREIIVHGVAALVACYAVVAVYVAGNALINGYLGTSEVNNISLLGKVMEYNMQLEAPPQYQDAARTVDSYVQNHLNVWHVVIENPQFSDNHYEFSGTFARAAILGDPLKYLRMTADLALTRNADIDRPLLHVSPSGPFRIELNGLARATALRYAIYWLLPTFAILWAVLPLTWRRTQSLDALGPVAILALYGTLIIAFGGFDEFGRYHTVFLPATAILTGGTLLLNLHIANRAAGRRRALAAALVVAEVAAAVALALNQSFGISLLLTAVLIVLQAALLWFVFRAGTIDIGERTAPAPVPR